MHHRPFLVFLFPLTILAAACSADPSEAVSDSSQAIGSPAYDPAPFEPSFCAGPAMTAAEAQARASADGAPTKLARFHTSGRTRRCRQGAGCEPWSALTGSPHVLITSGRVSFATDDALEGDVVLQSTGSLVALSLVGAVTPERERWPYPPNEKVLYHRELQCGLVPSTSCAPTVIADSPDAQRRSFSEAVWLGDQEAGAPLFPGFPYVDHDLHVTVTNDCLVGRYAVRSAPLQVSDPGTRGTYVEYELAYWARY